MWNQHDAIDIKQEKRNANFQCQHVWRGLLCNLFPWAIYLMHIHISTAGGGFIWCIYIFLPRAEARRVYLMHIHISTAGGGAILSDAYTYFYRGRRCEEFIWCIYIFLPRAEARREFNCTFPNNMCRRSFKQTQNQTKVFRAEKLEYSSPVPAFYTNIHTTLDNKYMCCRISNFKLAKESKFATPKVFYHQV